MTDAVARIVEQWRAQRPDLDPGPLLVIGRIHRVGQLLDTALRPTFARAGLAPGDFDVLAALRREGPPHQRTAGELGQALMVSSGGITKQVDRLVGKGLVTRGTGAHDGRVRYVRLTPAGVTLVDELIAQHLDTERRLLSALDADQLTQLATALGALAEHLEGEPGRTGQP
jgi:DNA-binding MarR family transcriptional regulator